MSGRQNKNKLKEKHVESSEQNSHHFIHQFHICGFWEKYGRQLRSIRCTNFFTILLYTFSERISWAEK